MDINILRTILTVAAFLTFLGIVFYSYSGRRRGDFDKAARAALDDDQPQQLTGSGK